MDALSVLDSLHMLEPLLDYSSLPSLLYADRCAVQHVSQAVAVMQRGRTGLQEEEEGGESL